MSAPVHLPPTTALADVAAARGIAACLCPPLRLMVPPSVPISGRAVTVALRAGRGGEGLTPLYALLSAPCEGGVLVMAGAPGVPAAAFGQILARAARQVGLRAAVVHGAIRDLELVKADGFPLAASSEHTVGAVDLVHVAAMSTVVDIGGTCVADGDLIVIDGGGAVSLPAAHSASLLDAASELARAEELVLADLGDGLPLQSAYRHKRAVTERLQQVASTAAISPDHEGEV